MLVARSVIPTRRNPREKIWKKEKEGQVILYQDTSFTLNPLFFLRRQAPENAFFKKTIEK